MNLLIPTITKAFPDWNKRIHTEKDADVFCAKREVIKLETELIDDLGEYRVQREKPIILIHKFVQEDHRLWVYLHECGHDLFHSPLSCHFSKDGRKRIEFEANIVAAIALMPLWLIQTKTFYEIRDEFHYPKKLIIFRKYIYDTYKI